MAWAAESQSDDLLTDVRDTGFLPDASDQDNTVLLRFADKELRGIIAAAVEANRGEHWLRYEDTTIVPGTTRYRLPRRKLGGATRAVTVLDPSGVALPPLVQVDAIVLRSMFDGTQAATPRFFAFEDDYVNLGAVEATSGWTLRIHYILQPSQLIVPSTTATPRIANWGSATVIKLADTSPDSNITTPAALVDIIRGVAPYPVLYTDLYVSSWSNPNLTLNAASTPLVEADFTIEGLATYVSTYPGRECLWLAPRDQTPFPPIPRVLWDALVHSTVAAALEAVRDPGAPQMRAIAVAKVREALALMGPRDQRNSQRIVSASPLRARRSRGWRIQ